MHEFTGLALWTEAHKVVYADHPPRVSVSAVRAMFAEASVVPGAVFDLGLWVDVQKRTLLITALAKLGVEVALGHLRHVVFVEELTLVPLLTQAS